MTMARAVPAPMSAAQLAGGARSESGGTASWVPEGTAGGNTGAGGDPTSQLDFDAMGLGVGAAAGRGLGWAGGTAGTGGRIPALGGCTHWPPVPEPARAWSASHVP